MIPILATTPKAYTYYMKIKAFFLYNSFINNNATSHTF